MDMKFIGVFLMVGLLLLSGCTGEPAAQQQNGNAVPAAGGKSAFSDFAASGNAKCTYSGEGMDYVYYFKDGDFRIDINGGQIIMAKKGSMYYNYQNIQGQAQCTKWDVDELEEIIGEQGDAEGGEIGQFSMDYDGFQLECVNNVVKDSDIAPPSGDCEDMTEMIKQSHEIAQQMEGGGMDGWLPQDSTGDQDTSQLFEGVMTMTWKQVGMEITEKAVEARETSFTGSRPARLYKGARVSVESFLKEYGIKRIEVDCSDVQATRLNCDSGGSATSLRDMAVDLAMVCEPNDRYGDVNCRLTITEY